MPLSAHTLRLMILGCILSLNILAAIFLRGRKLSLWEYTGWGILAMLLPIIGPFIVIWVQPGRQRIM
jgi:hypothetical protein